MGKYVIAGNWKMNKLPSETCAFVKEVAEANADAVNNISFVFADGSEYRPDGYSYLCSSTATCSIILRG